MERLNDMEKKQMKEIILEQGFVDRENSGVKKSSLKKQWMIAAAALMIGIPIFGFTFPAIAQHIPIIGGIFERDDLHGQERLVGISEHATMIGERQYADGFYITLMETFFDGEHIYLTYLIESDWEFAREGGVIFDVVAFEGIELFIDGVPSSVLNFSMSAYPGNDTYSQIMIVSLRSGWDITDENYVEVAFNISQLLGPNLDDYDLAIAPFDQVVAEGPWSFRFPVEITESSMVLVDETLEGEGIEVTINRLTVSPAGLTVHFSYLSEPDRGMVHIEWYVTDNLGNVLNHITSGVYSDNHLATGDWMVALPREEATQITITPIVDFFGYNNHNDGIRLTPIIIDLPQ